MRKLGKIGVALSLLCAITGLLFILKPIETPGSKVFKILFDYLSIISPLRSGSLEFRVLNNHAFGTLLYGAIGVIMLAITANKERSPLKVQVILAFFAIIFVRNVFTIGVAIAKLILSMSDQPIIVQSTPVSILNIIISILWAFAMVPAMQHAQKVKQRFRSI